MTSVAMTSAALARIRSEPTKFLLLWTGANLLGGFLTSFLENNGLQFMATLILTGAIIGSLQWGVLRRVGRRFRWWPLASAVGWIASTLTVSLSQDLYRPVVDALWSQLGLWEVFWLNLVTAPLWVLGMAIAQSFILSRQLRVKGVWLLASLLGAALQGMVSAALCASICQALPSTLVGIVAGLGWATYGVVTGIALLFLAKSFPGQEPGSQEVL